MLRPIQSDSIDKISPAIVAAQLTVKGAVKDSQNPHFKNRYASLSAVHEACEDALRGNGLAVIQEVFPLTDGGGSPVGFSLRTLLLHESGQFLASELPMCPNMSRPQEVGSALTYARRYGLAAMVGVCPEDDDAEMASAPYRNGNGQANGHRNGNGNGQAKANGQRAQQAPAAQKPRKTYAEVVASAAGKLMCHASKVNRMVMDDAVDEGLIPTESASIASKAGTEAEYTLMGALFQTHRTWVVENLASRINEAAAEREAIQSA